MNNGDTVEVKGLAELQKYLDELPAKMEANIMRAALRAGAKVVLTEAKNTAAFADDTGALRASLRITTSVRRGTVTAAVKAGPTKKDKRPFYARMVEFGWEEGVDTTQIYAADTTSPPPRLELSALTRSPAAPRAARLVKLKPSAWVREVALRAAKRSVQK